MCNALIHRKHQNLEPIVSVDNQIISGLPETVSQLETLKIPGTGSVFSWKFRKAKWPRKKKCIG